ncbi:MAG: TlpA family protein disulfide reductase [Candidatus Aminicenantales bacterium]
MKTRLRIAAGCLAVLAAASTASALMKTGQKFLPFSLRNVDDKEYTVRMEDGRLTLTITATVDGKTQVRKTHPDAVLIDFWATWCVPCRAAMPYMQKLHEKYKPGDDQDQGGLRLFGIALDERGSKVVRPFYAKLKITYPMLADPTVGQPSDGILHTAQEMKIPYDAIAIPVVYLIDASGTIIHVHQGFKPEHMTELEEAVKKAMAGGKR